MMKTNKFALALAAATLAPALAIAGTDEVAASFERDLQRSLDAKPITNIVRAWSDPLDVINQTLNREPDAIVASFDRSIYRQPFQDTRATEREADPLDAVNIALREEEPNQLIASFQRGMYREGVHQAALPLTYEDPLRIINIAVWTEMGDRRTAHLVASTRY